MIVLLQLSQVPAPPLPTDVFGPGGAPPWETLPPQVTLLIVMALVAGAMFLFGPLVRALARRIEGGSTSKLRGEVTELRRRLESVEQQAITSGEVDLSDQRLYELEERVEFVERLLSRQGGGGTHGA